MPRLSQLTLRRLIQIDLVTVGVESTSDGDVIPAVGRRSRSRRGADLTLNDAPPSQSDYDLARRTAPPGYQSPGQAVRDAQDRHAQEN